MKFGEFFPQKFALMLGIIHKQRNSKYPFLIENTRIEGENNLMWKDIIDIIKQARYWTHFFLNIGPKNTTASQSNNGMKCIQFHWKKCQKLKTTGGKKISFLCPDVWSWREIALYFQMFYNNATFSSWHCLPSFLKQY